MFFCLFFPQLCGCEKCWIFEHVENEQSLTQVVGNRMLSKVGKLFGVETPEQEEKEITPEQELEISMKRIRELIGKGEETLKSLNLQKQDLARRLLSYQSKAECAEKKAREALEGNNEEEAKSQLSKQNLYEKQIATNLPMLREVEGNIRKLNLKLSKLGIQLEEIETRKRIVTTQLEVSNLQNEVSTQLQSGESSLENFEDEAILRQAMAETDHESDSARLDQNLISDGAVLLEQLKEEEREKAEQLAREKEEKAREEREKERQKIDQLFDIMQPDESNNPAGETLLRNLKQQPPIPTGKATEKSSDQVVQNFFNEPDKKQQPLPPAGKTVEENPDQAIREFFNKQDKNRGSDKGPNHAQPTSETKRTEKAKQVEQFFNTEKANDSKESSRKKIEEFFRDKS